MKVAQQIIYSHLEHPDDVTSHPNGGVNYLGSGMLGELVWAWIGFRFVTAYSYWFPL